MSHARLTIIDDPFVPERADKVARAAGQAVGRTYTCTFEIDAKLTRPGRRFFGIPPFGPNANQRRAMRRSRRDRPNA